jgi:hypothetical protein
MASKWFSGTIPSQPSPNLGRRMKPIPVPSITAPPQGALVQQPVRLGLSRAEAAEYIGVGVSLFDQMVTDGRMPKPKLINTRKVWHRGRVDEAFAELPEEGQDSLSPWADCA